MVCMDDTLRLSNTVNKYFLTDGHTHENSEEFECNSKKWAYSGALYSLIGALVFYDSTTPAQITNI